MHEISYCEGVLEAVERRAAGRPVARIGVRAGTLHRLVPDAFEQSFQLVAAGGIADGATTEVVLVPATAGCTTCGLRFETADPAATCPSCAGFDIELEGGDELTLAWVQYVDTTPEPRSGDPAGRVDATAERIPEHTHERT